MLKTIIIYEEYISYCNKKDKKFEKMKTAKLYQRPQTAVVVFLF